MFEKPAQAKLGPSQDGICPQVEYGGGAPETGGAYNDIEVDGSRQGLIFQFGGREGL
jgi:hypothetical protein